MGEITLTKKDWSKVNISTWEDFSKVSPELNKNSLVIGIEHFFCRELCSPEQVFIFLDHHDSGLEIWGSLFFRGGTDESYLPNLMIKKFIEENKDNEQAMFDYSFYLHPAPEPQFC
jgi:hypothetical protein